MKKYLVIKESGSIKKYDYCLSEKEMWDEVESHNDRFPEILFTTENYKEAQEFFGTVSPSTRFVGNYTFDFEFVYVEEETETDNGFIHSSIRLCDCVEFLPITTKVYHSNIELFSGERNLTIHTDADSLLTYTNHYASNAYNDEDEAIEDAEFDFRNELENAFPNCHSEVIEDALFEIMNHIKLVIHQNWNMKEEQ